MSSVGGSSSITAGLGINNSGLPIDDLVKKLIAAESRPMQLMQQQQTTIKNKQGVYTNVQTKISDLLQSIKKLTTRNVDGTSIFDNMTGTSSDNNIATATASGLASPQTLTLEVKTLPTQTKAASTLLVGKFDTATTVDQLGISAGNFTVYANGTSHTIAVAAGDTMQTVFNKITAAVPEITGASIVNGKIKLDYQAGASIVLGAGGDTSSFLNKTHMLTAVNDTTANTLTASQVNTTIDLNQVLNSGSANLSQPYSDGTFTINGVSFDSTGKTLSQVIADINNNAAAGVTASFDISTNHFVLSSKNTGSTLISLGDSSNGGGSGSFLSTMGLINAGNTTSSQTAGTNAEFVLNGSTMYSTSTSVDETVTGLTGVTLNLKKAQPGTTISVTVGKDTASLKAAIKDVVDKYNTAVSYIDQQTNAQNKAPLAGDSRLTGFRNQLRTMFTAGIGALSGTAYDSLQQIGISTGAVGSGTAGATPQLQFDQSKFDAAFAADPSTVKKLFIGQDLGGALNNTSADDNMEGTFTQVFHLLDDQTYTDAAGNTGFGVLYNGPDDNSKGLFPGYQTSAVKRIKSLDDSIKRAQDRLDQREKMLRQQFTAMDQLIGQYQSQGGALNNLINQLSANSKG